MVYKFRIISNEVDDFVRDIDFMSDRTLLDFHNYLQEELNYDRGFMASFFLANDQWKKGIEFTLFDMTGEKNDDLLLMEESVIEDFLQEPKQRLLYVFDLFSERALFIELEEIKEGAEGETYPLIAWSQGMPPQQTILDDGIIEPSSPDDILYDDEEEDDITFESLDDLEDI